MQTDTLKSMFQTRGERLQKNWANSQWGKFSRCASEAADRVTFTKPSPTEGSDQSKKVLMGTNTPDPHITGAPHEVKESNFGSSHQTTDKIELVTVSIDEIATSEED